MRVRAYLRLLIAAICISGVSLPPGVAYAEAEPSGRNTPAESQQEAPGTPLRSMMEAQLEVVDSGELDRILSTLDPDIRRQLGSVRFRDLVLQADGGPAIDPMSLLRRLAGTLVREIQVNSWLLGQLLLLAVLASLLQQLSRGFGGEGGGDLAFGIALLALVYLGLQSFRTTATIGKESVDTMVSLMHAMLPMLAAMLAAAGAVTSATIFHPLLITAVSGMATVIERAVLPLCLMSAALGLLGQFSKEFPLNKLAGLARQLAMATMGLFFTLFMGVIAIRGAIAPVADGLGIRTAKFLSGAFIPVVGGMLADAAEVIAGSSLLLKNAIGAAGLVAVLLISVFPLVKILAILLIYRVATALIQPISDARLVDAMGTLADSLALVFASVAASALLFFVAITIIVGVGNVAAYIR